MTGHALIKLITVIHKWRPNMACILTWVHVTNLSISLVELYQLTSILPDGAGLRWVGKVLLAVAVLYCAIYLVEHSEPFVAAHAWSISGLRQLLLTVDLIGTKEHSTICRSEKYSNFIDWPYASSPSLHFTLASHHTSHVTHTHDCVCSYVYMIGW